MAATQAALPPFQQLFNSTNPFFAYFAVGVAGLITLAGITLPRAVVASWSRWLDGVCSATCGTGSQTRTRECELPWIGDITASACPGYAEETVACQIKNCPVDGGWSLWSDFGACSTTCGRTGVVTRDRNCRNPAPAGGGRTCPGASTDTLPCNRDVSCYDTCVYSNMTCDPLVNGNPYEYVTTANLQECFGRCQSCYVKSGCFAQDLSKVCQGYIYDVSDSSCLLVYYCTPFSECDTCDLASVCCDPIRGIPYMYLTSMEMSVKDLQKNSRASMTMSLAQGAYCDKQGYDAEDPRCAHIILTGTIVQVPTKSAEEAFAQKVLFSRHPEMNEWPKDHGWFFAKMEIANVLVLDFFGGVKTVPVEDYFKAQPV